MCLFEVFVPKICLYSLIRVLKCMMTLDRLWCSLYSHSAKAMFFFIWGRPTLNKHLSTVLDSYLTPEGGGVGLTWHHNTPEGGGVCLTWHHDEGLWRGGHEGHHHAPVVGGVCLTWHHNTPLVGGVCLTWHHLTPVVGGVCHTCSGRSLPYLTPSHTCSGRSLPYLTP